MTNDEIISAIGSQQTVGSKGTLNVKEIILRTLKNNGIICVQAIKIGEYKNGEYSIHIKVDGKQWYILMKDNIKEGEFIRVIEAVADKIIDSLFE